MGVVLVNNLISKILGDFRDQYGGSWVNKVLWIIRRVLFFMRSWFFDLEYISVDKGVLDEFLEYWRKEILPKLHAVPEVFDCDDFARYFVFKLREYVKEKYGVDYNGNGEAIGNVYSGGSLLGGHAWVIALVDTVDEVGKVVFVEPQLGEYLVNMESSDGWKYELQAVII